MSKNSLKVFFCLLSVVSSSVFADVESKNQHELNIYQVMQRVLDRYPTLKIAEMEVAQAAQQRRQIESSLGWILNSTVAVTHDLTGLGTPSDRLDVSGSIDRQLKSGGSLSLGGGYRYEDSSLSFSPVLPNPAHTTRLDLSYRLPLLQGEGNPAYTEGLVSADAGVELAEANNLLVRITLTEKVKDLFYSAVLTLAKVENAKQAVQQAKKLSLYINKNVKLGLSENKDQLQAKAQLYSKLAELSAIKLQWKQLQNSLNRLMLEKWLKEFELTLLPNISKKYDTNELIKKTESYHPVIRFSQAELSIAESQINSARDDKKDSIDLVMSVGTRTSDGNSTSGTISEKDWAGAVSLQYKHLFDDNGVTAKYRKALLEKNIALQNIIKINDDIRYTISSLISEIELAELTVISAYQRLKSESSKLKEAELLFRTGRADTAQLIQFQNEYSFAQLSYQTQKIDLRSRVIALQIYTGQFWDELMHRTSQNGVTK